LVKDWNTANPEDEVCTNQVIVAVCGKRGKRQFLLDEIGRECDEALRLSILDPSIVSI